MGMNLSMLSSTSATSILLFIENLNKIINERGDFATGTTELQKIVRDWNEQLNINKLDNLGGNGKILKNIHPIYQIRIMKKWKIKMDQ